MDYTIRFRLDVKNNAYQSKKNGSAEPDYQISAIIRINGTKEIHYYTGYRAPKSAWFGKPEEAAKGDGARTYGIHKNHTARKKNRIVQYSEVNRDLDLIVGKLLSLSTKGDDISKEDLINALNTELGKAPPRQDKNELVPPAETAPTANQLWVLADLFCKDHTVSDGRLKTRYNALSHFKTFEAHRNKEITFTECSVPLLTEFHKYLKDDDGTGKRYDHIKSAVHRPRKKNRNTISKILTTVKHFLTWSKKQYNITDMGNVYDYQVPTAKYDEPIILTLEEKRHLFDCELQNEQLELTRDLFYFQCSVGCRVSDFFNLKNENVQMVQGKLGIIYLPKKTKKVTTVPCRIPFSENALAILNRHRTDDTDPKAPLFPFPQNPQTYNDDLKKVFEAAGLDRMVTINNADGETEFVPLYSIAKSKLARSCFIDVLIGQGVTRDIIVTMSGHKPGSNAFNRYRNSLKYEQQNKAIALLD